MIIYYHCTSDNPLLLSFASELSHAHAQQKMTTPSRRARGRAMASHSDFRGG